MQKRGFTLIEVVIALVIFLVGALAVVRIFPASLGIVQNSGDSTVAMRLSDSLINQMKADGSTPQAVFDINQAAWQAAHTNPTDPPAPVEPYWQDAGVSVVGTSTKNDSLPDGPTEPEYEASALSKFRYIRGEKHEIQNAASIDSANPPYISPYKSPYILTNFPYDVNSGARIYIEMNVEGVTIDSTGHLDFTHATITNPINGKSIDFNAANDSSNATNNNSRPPEFLILQPDKLSTGGWSYFWDVTFEPDALKLQLRSIVPISGNNVFTGTRYYVSYQWADTSVGNLKQGVVNEPLNFPADSLWQNDINTYGANSKVNKVLQSVVAQSQANIRVLAGSVQVKVRVYLATIAGTADQANLGYIPMPVLNNGATPPSYFHLNVPVYVDYLVPEEAGNPFASGWRNLIDQSGANSDGAVFLPVNLLEQGAIKGLSISTRVLPNLITLPLSPDSTQSDFKKGKVVYPGAANLQVRTTYKGINGWARQISVTPESYVPYVDIAGAGPYSLRDYGADSTHYYSPIEPWREYLWTPGTETIYFHNSEAGKMVSVSFVDSNDNIWRNKIATIDATPMPSPDTGFAGTTVAALSFVDPAAPVDPTNFLTISAILEVHGVGVLARTAWLNGDQYQQSVATGYRVANAD